MARKYFSAGLTKITFKEFLPKFRRWARDQELSLKEKNKRGSGVSFQFFEGASEQPSVVFILHVHCRYLNYYDIHKVESNTQFRFSDYWPL